jgi:hypothetical protein
MTDYSVGTGTGGALIIRDLGSTVQAIVHNGNGSTWANGVPWSLYLNDGAAGSTSGSFNIAGGQDIVVWQGNITTNMKVTFNMGSTGTSGLGGPATVVANIQRATVPGAPIMIGIDQLAHQSFRVRFSGTTDGGSPITQWQIGYGLDPNNVQYTTGSNGTTTIATTFPPGSTVYAWARGANAVGWGPWSARASGLLLPGVKVRVSGVYRDAIPYVKLNGVWVPAVPYVKKAGAWLITKL